MPEAIAIAFGLLGGLAIFLFGMTMMSDGLQRVAGERMRSVLAFLTKNPFFGVCAGALVTAVLQSSSATTVMALGFVTAQLMTLPQAISIIFGANIGTTITAQLIAFRLNDFIYPIIFVGFILWFAFRAPRTKDVGYSILGFGLLFLGIDIMSNVMEPLATSPVFLNMIEDVQGIPALGVLVGMVMTMIVQSSSAVIAVVQSFASQPGPDGVTAALSIGGAIPILLGSNIGTTITALIACIGQSRDAKRTAIAHSLFNISGALLFVWLIVPLSAVVQFLSPGTGADVISRQIANAHTIFNVVMTIIWLPLLPVMVRIVMFILPEHRRESRGKELVNLDFRIVNQPAFAMDMLREESSKYCAKVQQSAIYLRQAMIDNDKRLMELVARDVAVAGRAHDVLINFATEVMASGAAVEAQVADLTDMVIIVDTVGHINERVGEIVQTLEEKRRGKRPFSSEAREDLARNTEIFNRLFGFVLNFLTERGADMDGNLDAYRKRIIKAQRRVRKNHLKRISKKICEPENKQDFEEILLTVERATNDCFTLVENETTMPLLKRVDVPANELTNSDKNANADKNGQSKSSGKARGKNSRKDSGSK